MARLNPFTPTFGKVPPFLAGRDSIIDEMRYAFENGPGDPNLSTILIGPRGSGKTALLSAIAEVAHSAGWVSASVSAAPGMLDDILQRAHDAASQFTTSGGRARITDLGIPQVLSVSIQHDEAEPPNWRTKMNRLLDDLQDGGIGLLITVDEVTVGLDEMIQLASVYQHFVREDRQVALVMAGLPFNVTQLVTDSRVSFLRRARQQHLGRIEDAEIEAAFRDTVEDAGKAIGDEALALASEASEGFPYMMQLVGYRSWASSRSREITPDDVRAGARQAAAEFESGVIETTYGELSATDVRFCRAMAEDVDASRLSEVAERMGVKSNYASQYKKRLLVAGVIEERGNLLRFAIPGFRDYLHTV